MRTGPSKKTALPRMRPRPFVSSSRSATLPEEAIRKCKNFLTCYGNDHPWFWPVFLLKHGQTPIEMSDEGAKIAPF